MADENRKRKRGERGEHRFLERRLITSMTLPIEQVKWLDYMAAQNDLTRSKYMSKMISEEQHRSMKQQENKELVAA